MPRAAIDIGSNSLLLTVLADDGSLLHDEARIVGLGKGLGDRGLLARDRIAAAEEALTDYVNTAKQHGIEPWSIKVVATSAARRAMNAQTWLQRLQRNLGLRVRVISGDEEARLTWRGAAHDPTVPDDGPVLVVDLGGGSTELVLGVRDRVISRVSLEIGSVRLTEAFLGTGIIEPANLAKTRNHVDVEVSKVALDPMPRVVVGVAGTVTTLAAMTMGLQEWDAERVHGSKLTRTDLARFVDAFLPATPEQRRQMVPTAPARADYLLAGATILERVLAASRRQHYLVSDRGLRYGLLR